MAITPMKVADERRLINNTLELTVRGLMLRELVLNGIEADHDNRETERRIRIYSEDGKLVILNSGRGMSGDELRRALDLSHSGASKLARTDGRTNRGEGAKVASMAYNRLGLLYRSRKAGVVSTMRLFEGEHDWCVEDQESNDITAEQQARYDEAAPRGQDFTEVKLLGNSPLQQTAFDLYGCGELDEHEVASELWNRFYEMPALRDKADLPISIKFSNAFRPGANSDLVQFLPVRDAVEGDIKGFFGDNQKVVDVGNGIRISYLKYARRGERRGPLASNRGMGRGGGFAALEWRGEFFDVINDSWAHKSGSFGMLGQGQEVTVIVHLPDNYQSATHDRYRERIVVDGRALTLVDFRKLVADNRPAWLLKQIDQATKKADPRRTNETKLIKLARMQMELIRDSAGDILSKLLKKAKQDADDRDPNTRKRERNPNPTPRDPTPKKSRKEAGQSRVSIPSTMWVGGEQLEHYPDLEDNSAVFYPEVGEGQILLNEDSVYFTIIEEAVERELNSRAPELKDTDLKLLIRNKIKDVVGYHVSRQVVSALSLQKDLEWDADTLAQATHPSTLAATFYGCVSEIDQMTGDLTRKPEIKLIASA